MKYYITKYALTNGIEEVEAQSEHEISPKMISVKAPGSMSVCYHKPDWHETKRDAIYRARDMQKRKIASLKEQIAKIEAMVFE